jgi:hypothetical protein
MEGQGLIAFLDPTSYLGGFSELLVKMDVLANSHNMMSDSFAGFRWIVILDCADHPIAKRCPVFCHQSFAKNGPLVPRI